MQHVARIVSGNRITLPDEVLKILRLKKGDFVLIEVTKSNASITPAKIEARSSE